MLSYLTTQESDELDAILEDWPDLDNFIESTVSFKLDAWQHHLCARLQKLRWQTGQRILVHAPPQRGKSIIVSQRFPAWLLGAKPENRIRLACYNMSHAARFGEVLRNLMQEREYKRLYPDPRCHIRTRQSEAEWSTPAREALSDAQPSFMALGLATGFVGQGADTLIIDDPYASPQDAASVAIRASVWMFWDESARVRINDQTNVVVMFHRYHEDDLAGRLLDEGGWELMRYAEVADGDYKGFPDPLGRQEGEKLSPRVSDEFIEQQMLSGYAWLGQFQGRPTAREGSFFKVSQLEIVDAMPANLREVRAWDIGATEGGGDYTCGTKIGTNGDGVYYVTDVKRGQWATDERDRIIRQTADLDGNGIMQRLPQDPGAAGKSLGQAFTRLLAGHVVKVATVSGSKEARADPFSSQVNAGNVKLLKAPWNRDYIEELRQFPMGKHDDQVDTSSDSFQELSTQVEFTYAIA